MISNPSTKPKRRARRRAAQQTGFVASATNALQLAQRAYTGVQALLKVVNTEYKHFDATGSTTYNFNGTIYNIFNPAQGVGDGQREGDSCRAQSLLLHATIQQNAAAAGTLTRFILYIDKGNTSTAVTDLIETAYVGTVFAPIAPQEEDQVKRYNILMDVTVPTDQTGVSFAQVSRKFNFGNLHTFFNEGTTTVYSGALKLLIITNVTANLPTVTWFTRTFFTDN